MLYNEKMDLPPTTTMSVRPSPLKSPAMGRYHEPGGVPNAQLLGMS